MPCLSLSSSYVSIIYLELTDLSVCGFSLYSRRLAVSQARPCLLFYGKGGKRGACRGDTINGLDDWMDGTKE